MHTAFVTGAMGNLGGAVTRAFLSNGYRVYGSVVPGRQTIELTNEPGFIPVVLDLLNEAACHKAVESMLVDTDRIDAAVLTVGGFATGGIADTSSVDILQQYRLNFETTYHIARPVFLQMIKQGGGRLFFIGARPGIEGKTSGGVLAYGLAKSLLLHLTDILNEEGRSHGVVCSLVVPGTIDTPQNRAAMPGADFSRWVKPADIADTILFYCTPASRAIRQPVIKMYGDI